MIFPFATIALLATLCFCNESFPENLNLPSKCTTNQTDMVQKAILACQTTNIYDSATCIVTYIRDNYTGQYWNAFVKNTETNIDTVAFWYMDSCIVQRTQFGSLSRTYIVWNYNNVKKTQIAGSSSQQKEPQINNNVKINEENFTSEGQIEEDLPQIRVNPQTQSPTFKASTCPKWKNDTFQMIINTCELSKVSNSAFCIMDKIRSELGQYWGVFLRTSKSSSSVVTSWYIECAITNNAFGAYSRYVNAWRTKSASTK